MADDLILVTIHFKTPIQNREFDSGITRDINRWEHTIHMTKDARNKLADEWETARQHIKCDIMIDNRPAVFMFWKGDILYIT